MKAMILAAGRGERLRPLTDTIPKPLLEVRGRPLIAHQLRWLRDAGVRDVVINLHHLGEQIEAFCGDGSAFGLSIRYSPETELLETGGGIQNALPLLGPDPFLILNGDIFTSFPLESIRPLPEWADIHLVLTPRPPFRPSGDFEMSGDRVTARGDSYVYCGISVLRPEIFAGHPTGPHSLRDHFFSAMAAGRLSAQIWEGEWTDIGSLEQLEAVNHETG